MKPFDIRPRKQGEQNPRTYDGLRIPKPNTLSRIIYDLYCIGFKSGQISKILATVGISENLTRVSLWRMRNPEKHNKTHNETMKRYYRKKKAGTDLTMGARS